MSFNQGIKLGIISALKPEAKLLTRKKLPLKTIIKLTDSAYLVVAGMGQANAKEASQQLIAHGVKGLISWGTAAALDPELKSGDLILPQTISSSEHTTALATDSNWREKLLQQLCNAAINIKQDTLLQTKDVIESVNDKAQLWQQTNACALDMESYAIAQQAQQAKLAFIAIRSIVDPANMALPKAAVNAYDINGNNQPFKLMTQLIKKPQELAQLIKLAKHFKQAETSLRIVAQALTRHQE